MNSTKLSKLDILITLAIGEAAGWLILVVVRNISREAPQAGLIPFWFWPAVFPVFCLAWFLFAFFLSRKISAFYQIGKFVLVGGLNFLIDIGVLNLMMFLTGIVSGWFFSVFKGISFAVAVFNSYFLNKFWTFRSPGQRTAGGAGKEFLTFLVVSLIGLGINNLSASLIVNWAGPQWGISSGAWANLGAIAASFLGMFWNFIGYKFIVFKR